MNKYYHIIYKWSYMIKILDQKKKICMDEFYVFSFYQVKPTIKYYLARNTYINGIWKFNSNFYTEIYLI
jgi:hypothetical protein